jgi:hypothetical protein
MRVRPQFRHQCPLSELLGIDPAVISEIRLLSQHQRLRARPERPFNLTSPSRRGRSDSRSLLAEIAVQTTRLLRRTEGGEALLRVTTRHSHSDSSGSARSSSSSVL